MIGYSDSGKDAGRLAAAWGLYVVQARRALCACKPSALTLRQPSQGNAQAKESCRRKVTSAQQDSDA